MAKIGESDEKTVNSDSRHKRLASALRDNLRRRKAQARGRDAARLDAVKSKDGKGQ